MSSTFAGFEIAKRGIAAARVGLEVTGQNMTNSNTEGYTRQRIDQNSIAATSTTLRYSPGSAVVGEGVCVDSISQVRDPYLDIRYRTQNAMCGETSIQLETLYDIQSVFNEIDTDGIDTQISEMIEQLNTLAENPGDSSAETILKTSASMLTKILNSYAVQLDTVYSQQSQAFSDTAIPTVNSILESISIMNLEIKSAHVSGNSALELQDERNLLIDSLSEYLDIEVTTTEVDIGGGKTVDELSICLIGNNDEKYTLVDNGDYNQLKLETDVSGSNVEPYAVQLVNSDGTAVTSSDDGSVILSSGDITGEITGGGISGYLRMLNGKGEYDDPATDVRGIAYYQSMLNTLASSFADSFNAANSTTTGTPYDLPLFEASDSSSVITAANIGISEKWQNSTSDYVTCTKNETVDGSKGNENVLYMITLFNKDFDFSVEATGTPLFKGTFQEFLTNISTTVGLEYSEINREYTTYSSVLQDIATQKASVSSVSFDEEGINLIAYNQSFNAASRFMTTLDEALNTIINSMGIVGR